MLSRTLGDIGGACMLFHSTTCGQGPDTALEELEAKVLCTDEIIRLRAEGGEKEGEMYKR